MTCTADERAEARDAASQIEAQFQFVDVDVLPPHHGPRDRWTLEIVVGSC